MAFKASNQLPETGLRNAKNLANQIKAYLASRNQQFAAGPTNADVVLATMHDVRRLRDDLQAIGGIPGIAEYARAQENDTGYNIAAEFSSLIAAMSAVIAEVRTTFPVDSSGYLLEKTWAADGTYTFRQFTAANLANLRARIDAVVAAIA